MWHYVRNNQYYGPVEDEEVASLIANGTIIRHTPVWREGMSEWLEACQTELKDKFFGIPPAPPTYMGLPKEPGKTPAVSYTPLSFRKLWYWFLWLGIANLVLSVICIAPVKAVSLGLQPSFLIVFIYSIVIVAFAVVIVTLLYRFWSLIQDGKARTSPAQAVGLCLIPLFNLYWYYVVFVGLAKDMNLYCRERNISGAGVNEKLVITWYWILMAGHLVWFFSSSLMTPVAFTTTSWILLFVIMKQFVGVGTRILTERTAVPLKKDILYNS